MKKVFIGLVATVMFSFVGSAQNLRADFLRGKTNDEIITSFNELSTGQKSALWVEKMEQLLTETFPSGDLLLIKKMRDSHLGKDLIGFKSAALSLTNSIPNDDFVAMFINLSDYKYIGHYIGNSNVSNFTVDEINSVGVSYETIDKVTKKPKCNCNWTCSWYGNYSTNCQETETGCGFFGNSFCNGHV